MSRVVPVREGPRRNFDTTFPDGIAEFHVDGIAQVAVGMPNSKVTFYRVTGGKKAPEGLVEQREAVFTITMATHSLVESFTNVLQGVVGNKVNLINAAEKYAEAFAQTLDQIGVVPSQAAVQERSGTTGAKKPVTVRRKS